MKARLAFLGLAWIAAFAIVMTLFLALGGTLTRLPLPLRALIISGVLVTTMTQLVIPRIARTLAKRGLVWPPRPQP